MKGGTYMYNKKQNKNLSSHYRLISGYGSFIFSFTTASHLKAEHKWAICSMLRPVVLDEISSELVSFLFILFQESYSRGNVKLYTLILITI